MKTSFVIGRRFVDIIFVIVFLAIGYVFADLFIFSTSSKTIINEDHCTLGTTACNFQSANAILSTDSVKPLVPSQLDVTFSDSNAAHLLLALEGVEMNMGVYKLKLMRSKNNQFTGNVMLPICMDEEMTWRGTISSPDNDTILPVEIRMKR
ncbi:hypothetical protein L4D06_08875 [Enterovibrio makurazakiensis]|uniref:Uncharacterized protein n=1 Tax=Enterovibrio gelatinilyticus TaxID=2899819 RepID=A0ABT5QW97_9GAMM|nr:hypothetical protein [Enterovibrio sp. ZSDZ42]MDD1792287.1 hypothetical protein [Enterovibrio sp. ZSDZ42]